MYSNLRNVVLLKTFKYINIHTFPHFKELGMKNSELVHLLFFLNDKIKIYFFHIFVAIPWRSPQTMVVIKFIRKWTAVMYHKSPLRAEKGLG